MPKIDWTPGQGRRGRPLRRVLGMGQQQGLVVMYGIAAVAILFAIAAALGAFDGSGPKVADGSTNPDGSVTSGAAAVPKDTTKSTQLLLGSVQHYADLLAAGQKIVGQTHYATVAAYAQAFTDAKSPAAQLAKFRTSPNPEGDTSYLAAERQAAAAYGGDHGGRLTVWLTDMAKVKADLGDWIDTAVRYQQGSATRAVLDAATATVTQDLATARTAASLGG